jgi:hypothetical protein
MKTKRTKTNCGAYLFALALGLCAVLGALALARMGANHSVNAAPVQTGEPSSKPTTIDDLFAEVARRVPAFGGMFIQGQVLQIYLTDTAQREAAEKAIVEVFGRERLPEGGTQVREGKYGFLQLKAWHDSQRLRTLAVPGVVMTSIAESKNLLQIGVQDLNVIPSLEKELADLGVPREAVNIVETAPVESLQTLQSTERPFIGGLQIQPNTGGNCTLGFPAVRAGQAGFVTNSHCTNVQGGVENTIFHQATINGVLNRIGVETADPAYSGGGDCPSGRVCRFSDSAFVARNAGQNAATLPASAKLGYLAVPDASMNIVNQFHIVGKVAFPFEGEHLTKVGRTTGMTSGEVSDTCVDVNQNGSNITVFCQNRVEANSGPGDSGSPVFTWSSATLPPGANIPARLYGILWGGSAGHFYFSALANVEAELGQLKTAHDQPGANSPPEVRIIEPTSSSITVGNGGLNIVNFKASVVDYEGCCTEVKWESPLDGLIGMGTNINHTFNSPGTRVVTVTAKDDDGAISTDSVTVTVSNDAPTVTIIKPTQFKTLYTGSPFVFEGDSWDPNEPYQKLPCGSLRWTSSNASDPFPRLGCTPSITFSTTGWRTITLKGTDSDGAYDTATVTINVVNPPTNSAPIVTILNPHNGNFLDAHTFVSLRGTANDPDNASPLSYVWRLKNGTTWTTLFTGTMNDGATVIRSWKPANNVPFHCGGKTVRLYLYVTDPDGKTGSAYVDVYIGYPPC